MNDQINGSNELKNESKVLRKNNNKKHKTIRKKIQIPLATEKPQSFTQLVLGYSIFA